MSRALWWSSGGGAISYERGTPLPILSLSFLRFIHTRNTLAVHVCGVSGLALPIAPLARITHVLGHMGLVLLQGYLAHKKTPPPPGTGIGP